MSEITAERVAANLEAAIKASGLTQREVAERASMEPSALSRALKGERKVTSLELALICTATGADVLGILEAEPLHGPSYRRGLQEGWIQAGRAIDRGDFEQVRSDPIGEYTGCGVEREGHYCDLRVGHWGPHHADQLWEDDALTDTTGGESYE
jgi:transcriptional regulator with XRE-family HTH domain